MSRRGAVLICLTLLALTAGSIKLIALPSKAPVEATAVPAAAVVKVTRDDLAKDIVLSAEFRPFEETDLHAKIAGYLEAINVDIGDQVKEGQVIAKLDPAELTSDFDRAKADYANAKLEYDRLSDVIAKHPGLVAQEDVDKAQAAYGMAKATMERAQTFVEYATITAPFDGVITHRYVDPGALVQASTNSSTQTLPLVHLAENVRLRLDFPVPEYAVTKVHNGTPVELKVQATNQVIAATVARTAGSVDMNTRTMTAEVDVPNKDLRIVPGMYASVKVELERKKAALSVPIQAVAGGDTPNVWLVNGKGVIEQRAVKIGLQTADRVELLSGVSEGDEVVFGSRGRLSVGMPVKPELMDAGPKPEAAASSPDPALAG